jgi:2-keto-4-pentenoate hydratase/2-oxohepta-3-ene-1,7-dioic acid hydratase in catechol pathway
MNASASPARDRFTAFFADGKERFGLMTDKGMIDLSDACDGRYKSLLDVVRADGFAELSAAARTRAPAYTEGEFEWRIPLSNPGKIFCIGVNYPDRNEEYKDDQAAPSKPSIFIRFPSSFTGHNQPLIRPPESEQMDYEGEITIIIGKNGRRISRDDAYDHIAALTLCNEGTIRDWVRHAKFNVTQGKNWDNSGAMGPWIVPFTDAAQLDDVALETRVNGEVRQKDRTRRMIFDFRYIVNYVSTFTTLEPGDVIVCGTPTGAGARFDPPIWLKPGDVVEVEAEGIGILRNTIEDER